MATPRYFMLADSASSLPARLRDEDAEHLLRVLRAEEGTTIWGLDGRGTKRLLRVTRARGGRGANSRLPAWSQLALEPAGEDEFVPAWGEPNGPGAWVELACPLPKGSRADDWMDRLVQHGLSGFTDLVLEHSEVAARAPSNARWSRLGRVACEALKQSRSTWLPRFSGPLELADWLASLGSDLGKPGAHAAWLDPGAKLPMKAWLQRLDQGGPARRIWIAAGPEGGFSKAEGQLLEASGFAGVNLGTRILRIETATELALGSVRLLGH